MKYALIVLALVVLLCSASMASQSASKDIYLNIPFATSLVAVDGDGAGQAQTATTISVDATVNANGGLDFSVPCLFHAKANGPYALSAEPVIMGNNLDGLGGDTITLNPVFGSYGGAVTTFDQDVMVTLTGSAPDKYKVLFGTWTGTLTVTIIP